MKILIVQTSFLGDCILSSPVIKGVKDLYPKAKISLLTTPAGAQLFEKDPLLDKIIIYDKNDKSKSFLKFSKIIKILRAKNFDKVYSLHRSYRTALMLFLSKIPKRVGTDRAKLSFLYNKIVTREKKHAVLSNLSILYPESTNEKIKLDDDLRLFAPSSKDISAEILKKLLALKSYILISPGSAWKTKRWHWQGYRKLCKFLLKKGENVIIIGSMEEKKLADKIAKDLDIQNFCGLNTIKELLYIMKKSKMLVCNDSMAMHMASSFKVPTVAIFCATSPKFGFYPWKNKAIVVEEENLDCKPCRRHGSKKCPNGTNKCFEFDPQKVIDAVSKLIF